MEYLDSKEASRRAVWGSGLAHGEASRAAGGKKGAEMGRQ